MKKILCVLMSMLLMIGVAVVPASAESAFESVYGDLMPLAEDSPPLVIVRGMLIDGLTVFAGTENERNALGDIKVGDIVKTLLSAGASWVFKGREAGVSVICDYFHDIFKYFGCDESGNSLYDVSVPLYPLSLDHYPDSSLARGGGQEEGLAHAAMDLLGGDKVYFLNYDWRRSQLDVADDVNALVEQALRDHPEFSKVTLISASMGGAVTMSYLYKYGYEKLNRCIFLSSTFTGTYVAGDCLSGRISFSGETLCNYISFQLPKFAKLFKAVKKLGVFDLAANIANRFVEKNKAQVYEELLMDTFATMPSLWGVTQADRYEECKQYIFCGKTEQYKDLIAIADELQKAMSAGPALLKEMEDNGVGICVVASYDSVLVPVYERAASNGDNTLETAPMLGGATVADYGKTLGDSYRPEDPELLSPDRVVDLYGVLFPNNTWAIRGAPHVACLYGSDYSYFVMWLITSEETKDVYSDPRFPRFLLQETLNNHKN
ncbi:MAG: alpha/beta hydrolase, partial [Clostridia bacterium]|nr:alpha/beta hydrolase [Clostridia bacterium]